MTRHVIIGYVSDDTQCHHWTHGRTGRETTCGRTGRERRERSMSNEVWILGGAGRSGRAIAAELLARGITPVLTGRDTSRLEEAVARAGGGRPLVAASVTDLTRRIGQQHPAVVINTIGPFTTTAAPIAEACLADGGSDYVDLANDVAAVSALLALDDQARAASRTLITGGGFGVTATESVVVKLCQDRPRPVTVRVDMIPSLATEAGPVGAALAGTILDGLPGVPGGGRYQGRRYRDGRLAPAPVAGDVARLTLPDGTEVTTAGMPLGELIAAQRASGAPDVLSASSEAPSAPLIRAALPVVFALLQLAPIRQFAKHRLAKVQLKAHDRPRAHSYGHAAITWADGSTTEGWLRLGDAQTFTGAVPAEIARRLLNGDGRPGAWTPAALFGPALAEACGADYLTEPAPATPATPATPAAPAPPATPTER
jgi:short subunit dehydrogenase-like uncharacterized protein